MKHRKKRIAAAVLSAAMLAVSAWPGRLDGAAAAGSEQDGIRIVVDEAAGAKETEAAGGGAARAGETEAAGGVAAGAGETEAAGGEAAGPGETEAAGAGAVGTKEAETTGYEGTEPKKMETTGGRTDESAEKEIAGTAADGQNQEPQETGFAGIGASQKEDSEPDSGAVKEVLLTEEETEAVTEAQTEKETEEHFLEPVNGTERLDTACFSSMRLVILAYGADTVIDPEHVIAKYDDIYLLQYSSVEQAMNAYVYYEARAKAAGPDTVVETASGILSDADISMEVTEEQNPIAALSLAPDSAAVQKADGVIALIDTGVSLGENVLDRVSLIDEALGGGNNHGNEMAAAIIAQNPAVRILSIRALGDDGRGTVSSVAAAMEYALNQGVDIINLSMYAKATLMNSVLKAEIQKAAAAGIVVVGSAGNDGADAANYVPGSVAAAYIIGACDDTGARLDSSNYGVTVDYNVVAASTSEAAAKFSGFVSACGVEAVPGVLGDGLIYSTEASGDKSDGTDKEEAASEETEMKSEGEGGEKTDNAPLIYVRDSLDYEIALVGNNFAAGNEVHFTVAPVNGMEVAGVRVMALSNHVSTEAFDAVPAKDSDAGAAGAPDAASGEVPGDMSWEDDFALLLATGDVIDSRIIDSSEEGVCEAAFRMPDQDVLIEASVWPEGSGVSAASEDLLTDIDSGKFTGWGTWCRCPAAYGNSSYGTTKKSMTVYDSNGKAVKHLEESGYCIQSSKNTPDINAKGKAEELSSPDRQALAKALFYLRGGPGFSRNFIGADGKTYNFKKDFFTTATNGDTLTANEQYYMTHVTISYLWYLYCQDKGYDTTSWNWNAGVTRDLMTTRRNVLNANGRAFVKNVVKALNQMTFPTCKVSKATFAKQEVIMDTAVGRYKTPEISYTAIRENSMSIAVPANTYVVITASFDPGRVGKAYGGQTAVVYGGESFHFEVVPGLVTGKGAYSGEIKISGDFAGYSFRYSGDHQDLAFGFSNGNNTFAFSVDWPEAAFVQIRKTDGAGGWNNALAGTQFTLYNGASALETVTVNGSGYVNFNTALTLGTTYTIRETKTPAGYMKAADISIKPAEAKTYSYDVANIKAPAISVKKLSAAGGEILGLSGYSVENGEFGIYTDQACGNRIGTLTTDANGQTRAFTLPCTSPAGTYTYYVREDKAPAGHRQNTAVKAVEVRLPADGGAVKTVEFSNEPVFPTVNALVRKLDMKGNPVDSRINGPVIFAARFYDSDHADTGRLVKTWYLKADEQGEVYLDDRHKVTGRSEYISDSFYLYNGRIVVPSGYLTVQEVEAPPEYIMDTAVYGWNSAAQTLEVKQLYNELRPCKIAIRKYGKNGTAPLAGVTFELRFMKASAGDTGQKMNYNRLLREGETISRTTDRNGEAVFENLDQGEYQITEIKTVEGQILLKEPIAVTLPVSMTQKEVDEQGNVDIRKGALYNGVYHFAEIVYQVTNTPTLTVPMTGGTGGWTYGYIGMGIAAALGAGTIAYGSRRKRRC